MKLFSLMFLSILWLVCASSFASSVVFSRDTITIRSVVSVPTTEISNTQTEAVPSDNDDELNEEPTEFIDTIRNHDFIVTIRDAAMAQASWITDTSSIRKRLGILNIYPSPQISKIYAENSEHAYDILFIDSYGTIHSIAKNIVLLELIEPLQPSKKTKATLYIDGGTTDALNIIPGNQIIHPLFPKRPNLISE